MLGDPFAGGGRAAAARRWLAGPSPVAAAGRRAGALFVSALGLARLLPMQRVVASRLWRVEQERGYRAELEKTS